MSRTLKMVAIEVICLVVLILFIVAMAINLDNTIGQLVCGGIVGWQLGTWLSKARNLLQGYFLK